METNVPLSYIVLKARISYGMFSAVYLSRSLTSPWNTFSSKDNNRGTLSHCVRENAVFHERLISINERMFCFPCIAPFGRNNTQRCAVVFELSKFLERIWVGNITNFEFCLHNRNKLHFFNQLYSTLVLSLLSAILLANNKHRQKYSKITAFISTPSMNSLDNVLTHLTRVPGLQFWHIATSLLEDSATFVFEMLKTDEVRSQPAVS